MKAVFGFCLLWMVALATPSLAGIYDLYIDEIPFDKGGVQTTAQAINGTVPGPTLRFKEGEDVVINVHNRMDVETSLHWHGLILPYQQDGVPGLTFDGIKAGTTHTYRFPAQQSGTYWFHSHSGFQEQRGIYGSIVIEPQKPDPFAYDREYVLVLSDWHNTPGARIMSNLKRSSDYYNYHQRHAGTLVKDAKQNGLGPTLDERLMWGNMRMMPTDIADVSGYTFLANGLPPEENFTMLFKQGQRVRLRIVNAAAMTFFDLHIPGLKMTVVQADGNNVQPVTVDRLRLAVAETYDVIVEPQDDRAYTIFAQAIGRTGFARATLAPRQGMAADVPQMDPRPQLAMADMGDGHAMDHSQMDHSKMDHSKMDHAKMGHSMMEPNVRTEFPFYKKGSGLVPYHEAGQAVLSYADLKALTPLFPQRAPDREIEVRLTGNMERYIWSINDVKYSDAEPIALQKGERIRWKFVNETMMTHPMHLHGMWFILDNGQGMLAPAKHVISVAPGMTVYADTEVDASGRWAFHCHLMYHMAAGMFREVRVTE